MFRLSIYQRYWLDFLYVMTEKEIKARYKFAVLGFLWIVLNPILQMLIVGGVFQFLVSVPTDHYFMFLFAGLLPWNFFSYTVIKNTPMILNERSLIKKAAFPKENIILSVVLSNAFHLSIALILFFVFSLIVMGGASLFKIHMLAISIFLLLTLTAGCSLLFSALNVRYRDINFFVQALMPLWFYATPIVYLNEQIPEKFRFFVYLNPLTLPIELMQYVFVDIKLQALEVYLPSLLILFMIFGIGYLKFMNDQANFEDWV